MFCVCVGAPIIKHAFGHDRKRNDKLFKGTHHLFFFLFLRICFALRFITIEGRFLLSGEWDHTNKVLSLWTDVTMDQKIAERMLFFLPFGNSSFLGWDLWNMTRIYENLIYRCGKNFMLVLKANGVTGLIQRK